MSSPLTWKKVRFCRLRVISRSSSRLESCMMRKARISVSGSKASQAIGGGWLTEVMALTGWLPS